MPDKPLFQLWANDKNVQCEGSIVTYGNMLIIFHNITLNRDLATSKAKGNESLKEVLRQKDSDEIIKFRSGYFDVPCKATTRLVPQKHDPQHFRTWKSAWIARPHKHIESSVIEEDFTMIIICRYEYANVYWTVMDLYNTFLSMKFLGANNSRTIHLLIFDIHSNTPLDRIWEGIFKSVKRFHNLNSSVTFSDLAWTFSAQIQSVNGQKSETDSLHR